MYDQARMIIETTAKALAANTPVSHQGRGALDNVQSIWRRHGWVPPTEQGKISAPRFAILRTALH